MSNPLRRLRGVLLLVVMGLSAAYTVVPAVAADAHRIPPPSTRPVLQLQWGNVWFQQPIDLIPQVTIWEDGTALFGGWDGSIHIATLPDATVRRLLKRAEILYDMGDYIGIMALIDPPAFASFSIDTERGRKTVSVEAFTPRPWWAPNWHGSTTTQRAWEAALEPSVSSARNELWSLQRDLLDALPRWAPSFHPTEISVGAHLEGPAPEEGARGSWPRELLGPLSGEEAQRALRLGNLGENLREIDGQLYAVTILPAIPILSYPGEWWGEDSFPRHPAVTAYTSYPTMGSWQDYYRFTGVTKAEIAEWYLETMAARGWRRAQRLDGDEQLWERRGYADRLLRIRFGDDQFVMERLNLSQQDLAPRYSREPPDPGCEESACRFWPGFSVDDARALYRAYLDDRGWAQTEPDTYFTFVEGSPSRVSEKLHVRYEPTSAGTRVFFDWDDPVPPPQGWPSPSGRGQDPLCEATRGAVVDILGTPVQLHESLCVTRDDPRGLRIQVAYGESFADFSRELGQPVIGRGSWSEEPLWDHLTELTGMPVTFFLPPQRPPARISDAP